MALRVAGIHRGGGGERYLPCREAFGEAERLDRGGLTTLILAVLAVVWAVVLASWVWSRTAGSYLSSVGSFRRHLAVLERTSPTTVPAANRLHGPSAVPPPLYRPTPVGGAGRQPVGRAAGLPAAAATVRQPAPSAAVRRHRQRQKRRRDVLLSLLVAAVATLMLAAVPGLAWGLYANVVFDLLLAAYVALLIRVRNAVAERDAKLSYLALVRPPPASADDLDAGELLLRRTAN